uniref:CCHC-type domain-containing protein n=1 Tax=Cacopsylla melanoneura TaxID=428564 RepID=A0A8D8QPT2_9HEMI
MDSLAVRRLSTLSEHVSGCLTVCAQIKTQLTAGTPSTQQFSIEVGKLRRSVDRLVQELQVVIKDTTEDVRHEITSRIDEMNNQQITAEDLLVELEVLMNVSTRNPQMQTTVPTQSTFNSQSQLPKLQLASFSGDILKWTEFWDRFSSVVDRRTDIPDVDKLAYLVCSLEGSAKQSIHGLEMTNANYKVAVQKLNERFGKPNLIVDAHYAALGRIPVAKNTTIDCRRVLDTVERHLRTLENLGEDVNHNQLRTTIMEKFPQEVIYELRLDLESSNYSVKALRESLEKIISAKETSFAMAQSKAGSSQQCEIFTTESLLTTNHRDGKGREKRHPPVKRSSTFSVQRGGVARRSGRDQSPGPSVKRRRLDITTKPSKRRNLECVFCQGEHYNDLCKTVATPDDRKRHLAQAKRCFQCLRQDHLSNNCTDKRKCFHCGSFGQHNRCLCPKKFGEKNVSDTLLTVA